MPSAQEKLFTEQDYYQLPEDTRAELIDGKLIYNLAAPSRLHQEILSFLHVEITNYIRKKKGGCKVYPAPFAVKLSENKDTIVEPDLSIICDRGKLTARGCTGAPDWIVEIASPGNKSHDYVRKLNLYMDAGVREYWIVDPMTEDILVYHLAADTFSFRQYTFKDCVPAGIYADLRVDFKDLEIQDWEDAKSDTI